MRVSWTLHGAFHGLTVDFIIDRSADARRRDDLSTVREGRFQRVR